MGRPPCCEKMGVKKGPWTPEEDIILVSYIQEHGPGNWRAVPSNTGLLRCSKSCRLRWTNYLRPGIKRGNFTEHEEKMIIHLQALLGNRWAAIASYLPQRTDNDIKNYWNTHLRKKLSKIELEKSDINGGSPAESEPVSKGKWERRLQTDIHMAKQALCEALSLDKPEKNSISPMDSDTKPVVQTSTYASSAENIARLLQNWMKKPPNMSQSECSDNRSIGPGSSPSEGAMSSAVFGSSSEVSVEDQLVCENGIRKPNNINVVTEMPFGLLENWLFEDAAAQGQDGDFMEMALGGTADLF